MLHESDKVGVSAIGRLIASFAVLGVLTGCAFVVPKPLSQNLIQQHMAADKGRLHLDVPPVTGPLSLEEAQARALKFNLERRVKLLEEAIALRQFDVSRFDMLPSLVAQAGYTSRDSDRITQSRNIQTGELIPGNSITQERSHWSSDLAMNWSVLDLGLGYYNSRQQVNRVSIASERRRKAVHLLMQDVRSAYWRALSGQKLQARVKEAIATGERALIDARKAENEKLRNPLDALRYRRQLLENLRLLESINQELSAAQIELAAIIHLPAGQQVVLMDQPLEAIDERVYDIALPRLEEEALYRNADLREAHYNSVIARDEVRKALVRMFPNISFNASFKYDTDDYQVNQHWAENGLKISWNLFSLVTGPAQAKAAEAGVVLADQRRLAAHAAVLTQVHLARQSLVNARHQFVRAKDIFETDYQIAERIRVRVQMQAMGLLDQVANDTSAILSQLRLLQAASQLRAAEGRLMATLGMEPDIPGTDEATLPDLVHALSTSRDPWQTLSFPVVYPVPVRTVPR